VLVSGRTRWAALTAQSAMLLEIAVGLDDDRDQPKVAAAGLVQRQQVDRALLDLDFFFVDFDVEIEDLSGERSIGPRAPRRHPSRRPCCTIAVIRAMRSFSSSRRSMNWVGHDRLRI